MELNITKEQIKLFKHILSLYEPYPLDVLDRLNFDNDEFDDHRVDATFAKKILIENGVNIDV